MIRQNEPNAVNCIYFKALQRKMAGYSGKMNGTPSLLFPFLAGDQEFPESFEFSISNFAFRFSIPDFMKSNIAGQEFK
jgi:hypothetical protein